MKQDVIEILDISGKPISCYEVDNYDSLWTLYKGKLLRITNQGLREYNTRLNQDEVILEKYRFVLAANNKEKETLLKVEPIRCYLRDQDMNAEIANLNPYQSVRQLRNSLQRQRKTQVQLIVNEKQLKQDSESILRFIYENAIIHVIQLHKSDGQQFSLSVKQPGNNSKVYIVEGVLGSWNVQKLINQIQKFIPIPDQFITLFYGGRILEKDKSVSLYHLRNNCSIYAIDTRKYMRKMSVNEYNQRVSEVKVNKQCNKQIMRLSSLSQPVSQLQSRTVQTSPNLYRDQRSGRLQYQQGDDIQYFKDARMNIDSNQLRQFEKRGNLLEQNERIRAANNQLSRGRMVTNQTEVYKDSLGFMHQINTQKTVFRNGYQTVDVDIMEDKEGNIIQIQQDIINIKKDSVTGQVTKQQTDIVEDVENNRTVTKKQQVRDKDGNILRFQTSRYTEKSLQNSHHSGSGVIQPYQEPQTSEQKLVELDKNGNIHSRQSKMIQGQQKTVMINKDTIEDVDGNIIAVKTGIVEIEEDDDGNVHKRKSEITETNENLVMVETDEIINSEGALIRKQKDTIKITPGQDGSIIKQETEVIEQEDSTIIVRKGLVQDSSGNLIKSQTKIIKIQNSDYGINVHQQEEVEEEIQVQQGMPTGTVEKEIEVIQDQSGRRITRERQFRNEEGGQPTLVTTVTVQNEEGNVVSQKNEILMINEDNENTEIQRLTNDYTQTENKVVVSEGISYQNVDGSIIKSEKSTIKVQQQEDGSVLKQKTIVTEEDGTKIIHVRTQLEDMQGKLISKSSDVYELETQSNGGINAIAYGQGGAIVANFGENSYHRPVATLNRTYNVSQEGNLVVQQRQLRKSQGVQNLTERQIIYDETGRMIMKSTQIEQNQQGADGETRYTIAEIVEQGNLTTVVETNKLVDEQGNQIRMQQGTLQIEKINDDLVRKQKQTIITQGEVKYVIHKQAYIDNQGNVLQQEERSSQVEGGPVVQEVFSSKIKQIQRDQRSGDFHLHERQVQTRQGSENFVVESRVTRNEDNQFINASTDVTKYSNLDDGTVYKHQITVSEKPGQISVAESNSILDESGQKIQGEVSSKVVSQGPNSSIITKQTKVYMDNLQKTIIEERIVEDSEGNLTNVKGKSKKIYYDENGVEQQREVEKYETNIEAIQDDGQGQSYKQVVKQIVHDQEGNTRVFHSQIQENEGQGTIVRKSEIIQNSEGDLLQKSTKIVEIEELEHGSITRQQTQKITQQKVTKSEAITISNNEGQILCEKQNKVQVTQSDELIRTSQTNTIRQSGQTVVGIVDTLEDDQGNIVGQSSNVVKIKEGEQAVTEHARRIAEAQARGEITNVSRSIKDDEQGNKHIVQSQVIEDQGKVIILNTQTIQSPQGELLASKTEIKEQTMQNGKLNIIQTEIIEQGGQIQVVQFSKGSLSQSLGNSQNLQDLLGLSGNAEQPFSKMTVKLTESINDPQRLEASNRKQQQPNLLMDEDYVMPQQFQIVAYDRMRNQTRLKVRYDQIIDQISAKLVNKLGIDSGKIVFFKDGNILQQYEMVSDLQIGPGDTLYYEIQ